MRPGMEDSWSLGCVPRPKPASDDPLQDGQEGQMGREHLQ